MPQPTSTVVATARTWLRKAAALLEHESENPANQWAAAVTSYEASRLLQDVAEEAIRLANAIRPEHYDEFWVEWAERDLAAAARRLRNLERIVKLENTHGRTPEEADAFRAKADELRRL